MSPDETTADAASLRAASPRILALGTSSEWCSVALRCGAGETARSDSIGERLGHRQSERLLAMIGELLDELGTAPAQLDAIAFDAGPGSFTGLRIGCGVAQGLGFALARPLLPIGALDALAWQALGQGGDAGHAVAVIDARMGEVYWACFERRGRRLLGTEPAVGAPQRAAAAIDAWLEAARAPSAIALGDGFARHAALVSACERRGLRVLGEAWPRADAIAALAAESFAEHAGVPARSAAPLYVRDKVALDVDEQRALRGRAAAGA